MILTFLAICIIFLITFGLSLSMLQYYKKDINPMQAITPKVDLSLFEKAKLQEEREEKYKKVMERG